ncbi:MAG: tripartite tricarboxylate transporter TctB family protein [Xanthobacteraceae bacterium]
MTTEPQQAPRRLGRWELLLRLASCKDVLAGLTFAAVAAFALFLSRNYPIGSALRMGTGYVPRLLCWILLGLGLLVLVQGLRSVDLQRAREPRRTGALRAAFFVTASLVIFALALERLGLVVSIALLIATGSVASRALRPLETALAAVILIALCWGIFIIGLGLTIPDWPEW